MVAAAVLGDTADALADLRLFGFVAFEGRTSAADVLSGLGTQSDPAILEPRSPEAADPWSHSGVVGYGEFPWHTDGAVAPIPPRWMILECLADDSGSPTDLVDPPSEILALFRRTLLVSRDRAGRVRYLPAAAPLGQNRFRVRWDPRVCAPSTGDISRIVDELEPSSSLKWRVGMLLIVDNHRLLHRRPAVRPGVTRRLRRTYIGG